MNALKTHTPAVQSALLRLDNDSQTLLDAWTAMAGEDNSTIFPLDLLASGAVKRGVSAAGAIKVLVASWNMVSARSLLRMHIDTALRFSAAWLVDNPHEFAMLAISGRSINKLKDREGKTLTDARLVEIRALDYPWLPKVYENLCGYVHFSATHLSDAIESFDDGGGISLRISQSDFDFPESSWLELIDCFQDNTAILAKFLEEYAVAKRLTREQLADGAGRFDSRPS
jgi:hypothetical protein